MRLIAFAAILVVACSDGQAATSAESIPADVTIDSIVAPEVAIARFVEGLPQRSGLEGGAASPDDLVASLFDALERRDTIALADMSISRSEYGYFYYPTSVYSRKPYELPPEVAWMLSSEASAKGARRLLARLGGRAINLLGYQCSKLDIEGDNKVLSGCTVSYSAGEEKETRRLFRSILIRHQEAKFLSYSGDF